ncbi:MAG: cupin domain-containing protein [Tepidiformaceae bacterium]
MPETTHTPTGQYPDPAPAHLIDIEAEADRLLQALASGGRQAQNIAREGGVSLVLMAIEGGDSVREHSTPGATTVTAIRGHIVVTGGGQAMDLRPGQLVLFQPGVRHDLRAEEQSVVLLTITGGDA